MTKTTKTGEYHGKNYRVLYIGQTKRGYRALLEFFDGTRRFWVDGDAVRLTSTPRRGGDDDMVRCLTCGEKTIEDDWCFHCGSPLH